MDPNIIMNSGYGRIGKWQIQQRNFVNFEDVDKIDETFLGKEVIVLYKYPNLLFGNYHQDILYHGVFTEGPMHNYEKHIWIKDFKKLKPGFISKKRFCGENPLLVLLVLKD